MNTMLRSHVPRVEIEDALPREFRILFPTARPTFHYVSDVAKIQRPEEINLTLEQVRAVVEAYDAALAKAEAQVRRRLAEADVRRQKYFKGKVG